MNATAQRFAVRTGTAAGIAATITARSISVKVIWPGTATTSLVKQLFQARGSADVEWPLQVTLPPATSATIAV